MRRFIISLLCTTCLLLMVFSVAQCARAEFSIIYPVDGLIVGGEYSPSLGKLHPYIDGVYDFKIFSPLYRVGLKYDLSDLKLDLNYGHWLNLNIPNYYYYQNGVAASLISDKGPEDYSKFTVFDGEVEDYPRNENIATWYLYYQYIKPLYKEGTTEVKFNGDASFGQVTEEQKFYYAADLMLPIKFNNFKIYPTFGYVKPTDILQSHYDLTYYVPGFAYQTHTGNCLTALTLEEQIPLWVKSDMPFSFYGSVFVDTGDVFNDPAEFKLHSDAGVGLVINVGIGLVRLDETITDEGNWRFVARTQTAF